MAANNYGIAGSPNTNVAHPQGLSNFGYVPHIVSRGDEIPAGYIYLRVGRHTGPNKGFGVRHIWAEHEKELVAAGYATVNDVGRYIKDIITRGAPIYCEFRSLTGKHRPTVLKSSLGIVILEPREDEAAESGYIYTVVTAYSAGRAHGTLVGNIR